MSELIKQFFVNPRTIGALCPSTPFLAKEITSNIGLEKKRCVVEIGPGTGAFTKHIMEGISPDATFLAVEINEKVYDVFKRKFPTVKAYNRCASELDQILESENVDKVDAIVSGLPWAAFPHDLQNKLLDSIIKNLQDDGVFTTFAYLQGMVLPSARRFRKKLKSIFSEVKVGKVVWHNIPPAFVYRCSK